MGGVGFIESVQLSSAPFWRNLITETDARSFGLDPPRFGANIT